MTTAVIRIETALFISVTAAHGIKAGFWWLLLSLAFGFLRSSAKASQGRSE